MPFEKKDKKVADANQPPSIPAPPTTEPPADQAPADTQTPPEKDVIEPEVDFSKTKPHVPKEHPAPGKHKVNSESDASKLFKKEYKMPDGDDFAYVTSDGNVFFKTNESSAYAHAREKKIEVYTVKP